MTRTVDSLMKECMVSYQTPHIQSKPNAHEEQSAKHAMPQWSQQHETLKTLLDTPILFVN